MKTKSHFSVLSLFATMAVVSAFTQQQGTIAQISKYPTAAQRCPFRLDASIDDSNEVGSSGSSSFMKEVAPLLQTVQLAIFSFTIAILVISWEDLSMAHPMRQSIAAAPLESTVRGMAFGQRERRLLEVDYEPEQSQPIPSYNEVMLQHRTERVPSWASTTTIVEDDVRSAVRTIQCE